MVFDISCKNHAARSVKYVIYYCINVGAWQWRKHLKAEYLYHILFVLLKFIILFCLRYKLSNNLTTWYCSEDVPLKCPFIFSYLCGCSLNTTLGPAVYTLHLIYRIRKGLFIHLIVNCCWSIYFIYPIFIGEIISLLSFSHSLLNCTS